VLRFVLFILAIVLSVCLPITAGNNPLYIFGSFSYLWVPCFSNYLGKQFLTWSFIPALARYSWITALLGYWRFIFDIPNSRALEFTPVFSGVVLLHGMFYPFISANKALRLRSGFTWCSYCLICMFLSNVLLTIVLRFVLFILAIVSPWYSWSITIMCNGFITYIICVHRHDIADVILQKALNTNQLINQSFVFILPNLVFCQQDHCNNSLWVDMSLTSDT
jgi:hypothetical protein